MSVRCTRTCKQVISAACRSGSITGSCPPWRGSVRRDGSPRNTNAPTGCVHQRTATIHNVGTVAVLFSTQTQPTTGGVKVQKVLISNALTASTEDLLRWYSLRWQIELF